MDEYIIIKYLEGQYWLPVQDDDATCETTRQWQELRDAQRWLKHNSLWSRKYKFVRVRVIEEDL